MDESTSLDDVRMRIELTDLVPSRAPLLEGIEQKFATLAGQGVVTLGVLRRELKNTRRLEALATASGIEARYLVLLRREIEGWSPEPPKLGAFDWLPQEDIAKLEKRGFKDCAALYAALYATAGSTGDARGLEVESSTLEALICLADLTRVQWVGPTVARMLVEAGYDSAAELAAADAEELCNALMQVNEGERFFKGKIGLRDVRRLVQAASYVPRQAER